MSPNLGSIPALLGRLARYAAYALIIYAVWGFGKRAWDCRRAGKLAENADMELRSNGSAAAKEILKEALSLCPENPATARVMAGLLDSEGSPQAVAYHLIVLDSGEATDADRHAMIESALLHVEEPGALERAVEVAKELGDPALPHLVRARMYQSRGETLEREDALRRAVATRPAPDTWMALALGVMARPERDQSATAEVVDLLHKVAQADHGKGGLKAIEVALESGLLTEEAKETWLKAHRSHPATDTASLLWAEGIAFRSNPESQREVVDRVVARSQALPKEEKIMVARWLVEFGAADRVADFWPAEEAAQGGKEGFLAWISAIVTAGDWIAVKKSLEQTSNPLEKFQSLAILSNAALAGGDPERSAALARQAAAACGANPKARLEVVRIFLQGGNSSSALMLFDTLLADPATVPMVVTELVPLISKGRPAAEVLAFYKPILKSLEGREHPGLSYQADRLRLLTADAVSETDLKERVKKDPANPSPRLTLALSHLLQGRPSRAGYELELIDSEIFPGDLHYSDRAVMAAILAAGGRTTEARKLASSVDRTAICPEEFALIERLLGGSSD